MWGQHLLIDFSSGKPEAVCSHEVLGEFVKNLVEAIQMKAYGEPIIEHFADHIPEAAGYTLVQLIETSSITGHFCDKSGDAYIDVFACKKFDVDTVVDLVQSTFQPLHINTTVLVPQAKVCKKE
jgi:S-adenosylmethionine/arginine decarboxylase-like enzyme